MSSKSPPIFDIQDCSEPSSGFDSEAVSTCASKEVSPRSSFDAASGSGSGRHLPPQAAGIATPPANTPKHQFSSSRSSSRLSLQGGAPGGGGGGGGSLTRQYLSVGNPNSIFRLPKPQVKLLKKTASVKQLYNSVLHSIKAVAGSRDNIVPELTKNFFETILRASDDSSPKLHVTKVKVKDGNEFGRHFCSEVHAVEVTAKVKDEVGGGKEQQKKYHLIVKSQPQNEDARRLLQPGHTFEKEIQMYGQVFHDMANYVRRESVIALNCSDSEVIDVPRCYYTRWAGDDNVKEDLIILENLYPKGFSFAVGQDDGLDRRHAELVIREMAKFHAISFCLKEGSNEKILEKYGYLAEDSLYRESTADFTKRTITPVMASLAELLRNTPGYEEHYEWFVDLARNFHQIQMEMVHAKNDFAVICHGDLWLSNILFKYVKHPDTVEVLPTEVKFIDFQSARFASLATDLILFLFTSVRFDLRRQMLGELVSLYYTTFLVSVRSLNVSKDIFTMEELLVEIEDHIIYGFLEGIWYLDIVHHGHVPKTINHSSSNRTGKRGLEEARSEDEDDEVEIDEAETSNEDDREEAELKRLERVQEQAETKEQKAYRTDFFELLDEVLFLLGKSRLGEGEDGENSRRCLRDTSMRFYGRNDRNESEQQRSRSICGAQLGLIEARASSMNLGSFFPASSGSGTSGSRKGSWAGNTLN